MRLYPGAVLVALTVAFVLSLVTAEGGTTATGRLGGDFPAFWGAGKLVLDGRVAELYDWEAQRSAQVGLHPPGEEARFLAFAYPPFFALLFVPLAALGYLPGYVAYTAWNVGLVALATWLVRPMIPGVQRFPLAAFAGAMTVEPLFRAATGGQNTALTLALFALCWRAWHDRRDALLGLGLGLLLFKPQFGLPLLGLMALGRRWGMWPAFLGTAAGLWGLGAALGGVGWIGWWWGQIGQFHAMDQDVNAPNSIGILGYLEAAIGVGHPVALGLGGVLVVGLVALLVALWARQVGSLDLRMAATAVGVVLVPPHAMHYDGGVAVLSWWVLASRGGRRALPLLAGLWAIAAAGAARRVLGVDPVFWALVLTLAVVLWRMRHDAPSRR